MMTHNAHARTTIALLASFLLALPASAKVTETFRQTYPLTADGVISLENVNGDVEIVGWDKNEVSLEAEKRAKTDKDLARIEIEIDAQPTRLTIKSKHERKFNFLGNWPNGEVRYKLMVPAGASLKKIDTVNSDITVTGVRGPVDLDTVNGTIEASGLTANGRFDTVNGSITVDYDSLPEGTKVLLDSVNGSCRIKLPKDASFNLDADNVNGRVTCDFPITLEKTGRHHLRGKVGNGGASVRLDSVNGSLRVNSK